MQAPIEGLTERSGEVFSLDILSHRMSVIAIFHQLGSGVPVNRSQNLHCLIDWTGGVSWARAPLGCCRQQ